MNITNDYVNGLVAFYPFEGFVLINVISLLSLDAQMIWILSKQRITMTIAPYLFCVRAPVIYKSID